jgi:hypothetical protein
MGEFDAGPSYARHMTSDRYSSSSPADSTTNANEDTTSSYGKRSQIASTACPSLPLVSLFVAENKNMNS